MAFCPDFDKKYKNSASGVCQVYKYPFGPTRKVKTLKRLSQDRAKKISPSTGRTLKLAGLESVFRVELPEPKILLFDQRKSRAKEAVSLVDLNEPPMSSAQLLVFVKQSARKEGNHEASVVIDNGGVKITKLGGLLICYGEHFFAVRDPLKNVWSLEAISDGVHPDKYYAVQHPPGELVCLELGFRLGIRPVAVYREKMEHLGRRISNSLSGAMNVKDVVIPRSNAPAGSLCRMYVTGPNQELHVCSQKMVFKFLDDEGLFVPIQSLTPGESVPEPPAKFRLSIGPSS